MLLKDRFRDQGTFLFRWRSFLPLLLLVPTLLALPQSSAMEHRFGENVEEAWMVFCTIMAFAGLAVRVATVGFVPAGTSGRNTADQRAAVLNTTGLYSVVRNPLYLGNVITLAGFVLAVKVWWLVLVAAPCVYWFYERIIFAEEAYLETSFGPEYEAWAEQTPAFIPDFRLWRRPALPFSMRTALRREFHGFYLIVVVMVLIEMASDIIGESQTFRQWLDEEMHWGIFFLVGTVIYLVVRSLRKYTTWLNVPGR